MLVELIYNHYLDAKPCRLIEVEDPNTDFKRLRDVIELKTILRKGYFGNLWVRAKKKLYVPSLTKDTYKFIQLKASELERASKASKIS